MIVLSGPPASSRRRPGMGTMTPFQQSFSRREQSCRRCLSTGWSCGTTGHRGGIERTTRHDTTRQDKTRQTAGARSDVLMSDSQDRGLCKNDILPRQAQDKHRENSKQGSQDRVDELRDGREVAIRSEIQAVAQKRLPIPPSLKLRVEDLERSV